MDLTLSQQQQLEKKQTFALSYLPTRFKATESQQRDRRFIWSFKKGDRTAIMKAAQITINMLMESFVRLDEVVFACIPASSDLANADRYEIFSQMVCEATGMYNAFSHIHIEGERLAVHEWRGRKQVRDTQVISFDKGWFNGKQVVVFDDILTRGRSYATFADKLEDFGADVLGGVFLARTALGAA